jgi:hypothetical protein
MIHPTAINSITRYSGDDPQAAMEWVNSIDDHGTIFGWTAANKLQVALVRLSGAAYRWGLGSGRNYNTWVEFKRAFLERFGEKFETLLTRLHGMEQDFSESVQQYCDRFSAVASQLGFNPDADDQAANVNASMYKTYFMKGLTPALAEKVWTQKPTTMQEAMEAAKYFEDHKVSPGRSSRERRDDRAAPRYRAGNDYRGGNSDGRAFNNRVPSRAPDNRDNRPADNRDRRPYNPEPRPAAVYNGRPAPAAAYNARPAPATKSDEVEELRRQMEGLKLQLYESRAPPRQMNYAEASDFDRPHYSHGTYYNEGIPVSASPDPVSKPAAYTYSSYPYGEDYVDYGYTSGDNLYSDYSHYPDDNGHAYYADMGSAYDNPYPADYGESYVKRPYEDAMGPIPSKPTKRVSFEPGNIPPIGGDPRAYVPPAPNRQVMPRDRHPFSVEDIVRNQQTAAPPARPDNRRPAPAAFGPAPAPIAAPAATAARPRNRRSSRSATPCTSWQICRRAPHC